MLIKLKFKFPEIILGILIAVAIFAMGMVFSSGPAQNTFSNQQAQQSTGEKAEATEKADEKIAQYTLWLTIVTSILAGSTILLWIVTERTLRHGKETSERQLRAYIFVERTHIRLAAGNWIVTFRMKNFGQTPAHNVQITYIVEAVDWIGGRAATIPVPLRTENLGSMGPLSDFFDMDVPPVQGATLDDIVDGTKAIYLVGTITYDTAFNRGRKTDFRYYVGGDVDWSEPSEMSADEDGNGAS